MDFKVALRYYIINNIGFAIAAFCHPGDAKDFIKEEDPNGSFGYTLFEDAR